MQSIDHKFPGVYKYVQQSLSYIPGWCISTMAHTDIETGCLYSVNVSVSNFV